MADLAAGATPLNDTNLDVMDTALDSQNSRITTMEAQRGASFGSGGRELYVATSVSDANSGTSWAQAKATIQAAAAALYGPGTSMWARGVTRAHMDLSAFHGCRVVGRGIETTVIQASTTTEDEVTTGGS